MRRALLLLILVTSPALAATFTVNTTQDRVDADPADGTCDADAAAPGEQCTLRAAIQQSNATPESDTVTVPAGIYRLTIQGNDEDAAATGDLDVTGVVTVVGAGPSLTVVDGKRARDRVFEIRGVATISGLTIRRGKAPKGSTGGGGIRNHGTLTLTDAVVTQCRGADDAGGIDVRGGHTTLRDVVVSRNRSGDDGGGIDVDGGIVELTRVLIQRNRARDEGGGLENSGAVVMLTDCRIVDNKARSDGGGLVNEDAGTMVMSGCFIGGNRAKVGGGLDTDDAVLGVNTTTIANTTIAKNRKKDCAGPLTSLGGNADNDGSCHF
jgi:hypothetical protein